MKSVFFCGHKSPYGISHLEPLLSSKLKISKVIVADDARWEIFRNALGGVNYQRKNNIFAKKIFFLIKKILKVILRKKTLKKNIFDICKKHHVDLEIIHDVNDDHFIKKIKSEKFDFFISAAYPQIFSENLLGIAPMGAANFHPSALPKFRGAHPHYWALATGYPEGGVTVHYMTPKIDDGDIIAQITFPISNFNYREHYEKIISESCTIVKKLENFILTGSHNIIKQDSNQATYYRNDRQIHHRIFWNIKSSDEIINMIRAGSAFFLINYKKVFIQKAISLKNNRNMTNEITVPSGTIVDIGVDNIVVQCKKGFLSIQSISVGLRTYSAHRFLKKFRLDIGSIF